MLRISTNYNINCSNAIPIVQNIGTKEKESKRLTIYQIRGMICITATFFVACLLWKIDAMPRVLFKLHNCWKAQFNQLNKLHLHGLNLWFLYAIIQTLAWYYVLNFLSIAIVYILISAHDGWLRWLILAMKVDVFFYRKKRIKEQRLDLTSLLWPERILDLTILMPISHDIAY
jgi:hypothetical protein